MSFEHAALRGHHHIKHNLRDLYQHLHLSYHSFRKDFKKKRFVTIFCELEEAHMFFHVRFDKGRLSCQTSCEGQRVELGLGRADKHEGLHGGNQSRVLSERFVRNGEEEKR